MRSPMATVSRKMRKMIAEGTLLSVHPDKEKGVRGRRIKLLGMGGVMALSMLEVEEMRKEALSGYVGG